MSSRRTEKVAEAIRETVSMAILFGLKDPRVKNVTVIRAEVSPDIRNAKVYVSVMGDEKVQSLTMRGLDSARGFLQSKVADRLQTRNTPILKFVLDPGVKLSAMASAAIREVLGESPAADISVETEQGRDSSGAGPVVDDAVVEDAVDGDAGDGDADHDDAGHDESMEGREAGAQNEQDGGDSLQTPLPSDPKSY